jgi:putative intracellular protease/amidase
VQRAPQFVHHHDVVPPRRSPSPASAAVDLVRRFVEAGKPVAAICHAPWTLIQAGVVSGVSTRRGGVVAVSAVL